MRILFATAEFTPLARVGGLAEASAGLVGALRDIGHDVELVLPDYEGRPLAAERTVDLAVPDWASPARARRGVDADAGGVTLVDVPGIRRPHPYLETGSGEGWPDNDARFVAFSTAVAAIATGPDGWHDVVHLNDWHAAAALAYLPPSLATILAVHTLGYQGVTSPDWAERLGPRGSAYLWHGTCNLLAGGLRLADRVVAVSPTYAREITGPMFGFGLHELLASRGADLVGIRNGIDTITWDPGSTVHLPAPYSTDHPAGKSRAREALRSRLGLPAPAGPGSAPPGGPAVDPSVDPSVGAPIGPPVGPLIGMVTRLVDQKGIDLVLDAVPYLEGLPAQLVVLGTGNPAMAGHAQAIAGRHPGHFAFTDGYDESLAHLVFAGSDLYLMPSRFEPCGLSQMQAMRYGAVPVVSAVGGLRDTVVDADRAPGSGNGFVMRTVDVAGVVDALHRATRAWRNPRRRASLRRRGMMADWSWHEPVERYVEQYEIARSRHSSRR